MDNRDERRLPWPRTEEKVRAQFAEYYRCSFLLLTKSWQAGPPLLRKQIYTELKRLLPAASPVRAALQANLSDWQ